MSNLFTTKEASEQESRTALLAAVEAKPENAALTIDEVAALLDLSRWTITPMLEGGALPGFIIKSGRKKKIWRIRKGALMKWIEQRETETRKQIKSHRGPQLMPIAAAAGQAPE